MASPALILVDMQNAFLSEKGSFQKRGYVVLNSQKVVQNCRKLLAFARTRKILVVFTRLAFKKNYSDAGLLLEKAPKIRKLDAYIENTWDSEIITTLQPKQGEIVITKKRYDPFLVADFERYLRKRGIKKLIVVGVLTNVCVESTIRSALDRGFESVVVKDATTTYSRFLQDASLKTIASHFGKIATTGSIILGRFKVSE